VAGVTARRLRALGCEWDFAPVADVHSEIDNPVIGPRAYGTDPAAVAAAVGEIVRAFRDAGVASCLKHFPGHGDTRLDSHLTLPAIDADEALLSARELVPFRANLGADSVMTAHVIVRALDAARPATFSPRIVHTLLRETLGYQGIAITDALEMKGASGERGEGEAGKLALEAGCDLLLFAHWDEDVRRARLAIADAIVDGPFDRTYLDLSRLRLAAFDAARPAPSAAELEVPLESLTPPDWEARLEAIITRGLRIDGALPAAAAQGGWRVSEADYKHGASLAADLAALGIGDGGAAPSAQVIAVSSRVPLTPDALAELRARCAQMPTVLVGLQSDAFLAQVPEAAVRVSASDQTPLTRRVVARVLAGMRAKAAARA
jgi:beta-N-acetylhexosaminidase